MTFQIRNFNHQDFQRIRDWTASQHWNPGIWDFLAFKTIDKEGFWVGLLNGQPITSIAAVQYDENFAYVGMYFTKPEFRGKGYGIQVWKKGLSRLTAKNIGLEATLEQQLNYMKCGFRSYHKILRQQLYGLGQQTSNNNLVDCHDINFEKLIKYDKELFFTQRGTFLQKWINLPQSKSLVYIDQQQQIQGYGVLRLAAQGYTIGPLFGNSYEVVSQILKALRGFVGLDKKIFIDVPDINEDAMKLVKQQGMKGDLVYKRMYTNGEPQIPMSTKVYGITSCEFG